MDVFCLHNFGRLATSLLNFISLSRVVCVALVNSTNATTVHICTLDAAAAVAACISVHNMKLNIGEPTNNVRWCWWWWWCFVGDVQFDVVVFFPVPPIACDLHSGLLQQLLLQLPQMPQLIAIMLVISFRVFAALCFTYANI